MNLREMVEELERRCPGCSFNVDLVNYVLIDEFGRSFAVDLEKLGQTAEEWFGSELDRHSFRPPEMYRVICPRCGTVVIGYGNYLQQVHQADQLWHCPQCGGQAIFDDESYEIYMEYLERREGDKAHGG